MSNNAHPNKAGEQILWNGEVTKENARTVFDLLNRIVIPDQYNWNVDARSEDPTGSGWKHAKSPLSLYGIQLRTLDDGNYSIDFEGHNEVSVNTSRLFGDGAYWKNKPGDRVLITPDRVEIRARHSWDIGSRENWKPVDGHPYTYEFTVGTMQYGQTFDVVLFDVVWILTKA